MPKRSDNSTGWLKASLQPTLVLAAGIPISLLLLGVAGVPMRIAGNPFGLGFIEWEINPDRQAVPDRIPSLLPADETLVATSENLEP
jgi:hypothetical protein